MNPLKQVNKHQNYIIFTQLHQDKPKVMSQRKTSQTGWISELESGKLVKKPLCTAEISMCVVPLWGYFWNTFWGPNWAQVCLLEILSCILSNPSKISEFGAHSPLQNLNLPRLLPVCENRGREVIFRVFLTSWWLKTCPNFFSMHQ